MQCDSESTVARHERFIHTFSGINKGSMRDELGESSLGADVAFSSFSDKPLKNHSPSRPAPGLKYPVIEQRPSLEGKVERSQSANYVEKRDRFVKEYSTESSMMRE